MPAQPITNRVNHATRRRKNSENSHSSSDDPSIIPDLMEVLDRRGDDFSYVYFLRFHH